MRYLSRFQVFTGSPCLQFYEDSRPPRRAQNLRGFGLLSIELFNSLASASRRYFVIITSLTTWIRISNYSTRFVQAMSRDTKLNEMQHPTAVLRKLCKQYECYEKPKSSDDMVT